MSVHITNSIPPTLNDLLVKLKILGMIERGRKINMGTMTFVDSSSWWGSCCRGLAGEGRKSLMVHLSQIIQQAISAIDQYQDTEFCRLIVNNLAGAKVGIHNLTFTYKDDPNVTAQISLYVENINIQLTKNSRLLDNIYKSRIDGETLRDGSALERGSSSHQWADNSGNCHPR